MAGLFSALGAIFDCVVDVSDSASETIATLSESACEHARSVYKDASELLTDAEQKEVDARLIAAVQRRAAFRKAKKAALKQP